MNPDPETMEARKNCRISVVGLCFRRIWLFCQGLLLAPRRLTHGAPELRRKNNKNVISPCMDSYPPDKLNSLTIHDVLRCNRFHQPHFAPSEER